jgi:polysaccharide pyruvyl transferase WcaK-like protein
MCKKAQHIAVYGAIAEAPPQLVRPLQWLTEFIKRAVKLQRDIYRFQHDAEFHCDYRDYVVDHASNIGDIAIAETIRLYLSRHNLTYGFSNVDWGGVDNLHAIHARRHVDLLIVAGGGYFLFDYDSRLPQRLRDDLRFLRDTGIPYVFWGVGVNQPFSLRGGACVPTPSDEDAATMAALLAGARLITVRDEYSVAFLSAHTQQPVHLVGDPALHTAEALGLGTVRQARGSAPSIGINFSFHGPTSNRFLLANLPAYIRALSEIQRQTHCHFRYITHHACEYPVPRLLRTAGLKLDIVHADLAGTCSAYRGLDLHIGGMLHSCILAASSGTPWIAIAYDIKHKHFNRLMGMDVYYQDARNFSASTLVMLALQALERRVELRAHIDARRTELRTRIAEIVDAILPPHQP